MSTLLHICVMCLVSSAAGLFSHMLFIVDAFLCKAVVSSSTLARTTWKATLNPSAVSLTPPNAPSFEQLQALFFTNFALPVDESPHARHGSPLIDPWQFHDFPGTRVFTDLQCAAFPLP